MTILRRLSLAALAGVVLAALSPASPALAVETAAHRAAYRFKLKTSRSDSRVVDIKGGMTYEITDTCDGWTVNQTIVLNMFNQRNRVIRSVTSYSSWESKDGQRFRFNSKTTRNGKLSERYRGTATLRGDGSGGVAVFTLPKKMRIKLPPNSIFPTAHSELVMTRAKAGGPFVWRILFDGTTNEGPYGVSAVIGKPRTVSTPAQRKAQRLLGKLGAGKFWPVKLAFFPNASRTPEPEYELAVGMHPNSVARWLVMDYGSFVIDARLAKFEILPKADC
ncbi:MAG: cell envelope integrity EipB family protein [Alphaproteobacteria bacterium]